MPSKDCKNSGESTKYVDRIEEFARFNVKTPVVRYRSIHEYKRAELHKLPSSSSWTKEETDCLMDLCEQFDLRFVTIADRFVSHLKNRYDQKQLRKLNLEGLCESAIDSKTKMPISE